MGFIAEDLRRKGITMFFRFDLAFSCEESMNLSIVDSFLHVAFFLCASVCLTLSVFLLPVCLSVRQVHVVVVVVVVYFFTMG